MMGLGVQYSRFISPMLSDHDLQVDVPVSGGPGEIPMFPSPVSTSVTAYEGKFQQHFMYTVHGTNMYMCITRTYFVNLRRGRPSLRPTNIGGNLDGDVIDQSHHLRQRCHQLCWQHTGVRSR